MILRDVAHARSGDKGDVSNVSVIALDERDYPYLVEHVTVDRVQRHFGVLVGSAIVRYECPTIGALNFVIQGALGGGVTRSPALDAHGKAFSSLMLNLVLPDAELPSRK